VQMGAESRKLAEEKYDVRVVTRQLLRFYGNAACASTVSR